MALVDPQERTAAAAYTGVARPLGAALAGVAAQAALAAPFLIAGLTKAAYDLVLWRWFRQVPLPAQEPAPGMAATPAG